MEPILISIAYFVAIFALCEIGRQMGRKMFKRQTQTILDEFLGTLQLAGCVFELGTVMHHYITCVYIVALGLVAWIHFVTAGPDVCANPAKLFERFIRRARKQDTAMFVPFMLAEVAACVVAIPVVHLFWRYAWNFIHRFIERNWYCASELNAPLWEGLIAETLAATLYHIVALQARERFTYNHARLVRALMVACSVAVSLHYTGRPVYFNPLLATTTWVACKGWASLPWINHLVVYWLGPFAGWILGGRLHEAALSRY